MTANPTHDDDLWSWVDAEAADAREVPPGEVVTAVMVVRNGEAWLRDALDSMRALEVKPGRLIVVDNQSTDDTPQILTAALASDAGWLSVVEGQASWGFGTAVAAALQAVEATEWIWLLHDDVVVGSTALKRLLEQTARTPDADVLGPMLLRPSRRTQASRIAELGVSISHTGRRELGLEPGEVAQGQHEPTDVLGVSTCGMLIRRAVYDDLGGFDEAVPLHRDGVELGWRANLAGYRVVTCPSARITHREAGRTGRRPQTLATSAHLGGAAYDRSMAMRTVSAHSAGLAGVGVTVRLLIGSLLRALGFLLGKRVDLARQELAAAGDFRRGRRDVAALRRRVRALAPTPEARRRVARLRPHLWSSWGVGLETVARAASERLRAFRSGGDDATIDELTGDDFADRSARSQRPLLSAVAILGVLAASLVAGRRLLGLGEVTSSGLLPAPSSLGAAFQAYLTPPMGQSGEHPAWLGLAALASVPLVSPTWAVVAALLFGVLAAAVTAALYLEPYVANVRARWLTAVLYALLPVIVGGYSRGQVWLIAWTIVLPVFAIALRSWGKQRGLDVWRSPAGAALSLAILAAIAPLALPLGAVCVIGVAFRRRRARMASLVSIAAATLVLLPWAPALLRQPGRLLTGPEPLLATLSAGPAWEVFLGRSAGPGLPPLGLSIAIVGLLWLGAAVAVYLRPTAWGVWAGAVVCLVLAAGLSRLIVQVGGGQTRPEVTMWLVAGLGLLLAGSATAVDSARADLEAADFGLGQGLVLASTVIGSLALVLALGWWVWGGVGAPVTRSDGSSVPVFVRDAEVAQQSRALLVAVQPQGVTWFVDEPGHPRWGDAEEGLVLGGAPDAVAAARQAAAHVASGKQMEGLASELGALGISHLRVSGASPEVVAALGSTPSLQRGTDDAFGTVWIVTGKPSKLQVVDATNISFVSSKVEPGPSGRSLIVAEAPDVRRTVSVGGTVLTPTSSPDWRAAYDLADASGPLEIRTVGTVPWWAWLQMLGLLVLAVFAAPSVKRDDDMATVVAPRRASSTVEVIS